MNKLKLEINKYINVKCDMTLRHHQVLICMPQLSGTSKQPCHLKQKGRKQSDRVMATDKGRQFNKTEFNQPASSTKSKQTKTNKPCAGATSLRLVKGDEVWIERTRLEMQIERMFIPERGYG